MRYAKCLLLLMPLMACRKPVHRNNEITKIELATLWGWGDFRQSISIDTSLIYNYYGNGIADKEFLKKGYFKGSVTNRFWNVLNSKFENIRYKTLPNSDTSYVSDGSQFEVIIYWKNKRKKIEGFYALQNDSIRQVLQWLNDSYRNIKLNRTKDTFKFETTLQKPLRLLPIPKNFKFLPPKLKKPE